MRRLRSSAIVSSRVRSGCLAITANISVANSSSGETLPPRGFGVALLWSRQRCSHLTADATLTSKRSAASRRDAPAATASITRCRGSPAAPLAPARKENQCTKSPSSLPVWESPDSNWAKTALAMNASGVRDLIGSLTAHDAERIWARLFDLSWMPAHPLAAPRGCAGTHFNREVSWTRAPSLNGSSNCRSTKSANGPCSLMSSA